MSKKLWKVLGKEKEYTDEELVALIREKKISGDDMIMTEGFKKWVKVADTIYQFYL